MIQPIYRLIQVARHIRRVDMLVGLCDELRSAYHGALSAYYKKCDEVDVLRAEIKTYQNADIADARTDSR